MEYIAIRCPGCGSPWRVLARDVPQFEACPRCGELLAIPADESIGAGSSAVSAGAERVLGRSRPSQWRSPAAMGLTLLASVAGWFLVTSWLDRHAVRPVDEEVPASSSVVRLARNDTPPRPRPVYRVVVKKTAEDVAEPEFKEKPAESVEAGGFDEPLPAESREAVAENAEEAIASESSDRRPVEAREPAAGNAASALQRTVGRNFKQMPIQDVVNYLTETTGVSFELDMKSLWFDQGATRNMPVTIDAEQMTVAEFLDQVVAKQMKASYQVEDHKVLITSRKASNRPATAK